MLDKTRGRSKRSTQGSEKRSVLNETGSRAKCTDRRPDRDRCSARLEAEPNESLSVTARAFRTELEIPNEPEMDLNKEVCSEKLEAEPSEPLKALKSEVRSTKPETEPIEPVRNLNKETCSTRPEVEPSAPVSNRNSELCSAILEDSPIEPIRDLTRPLIWEVAIPKEPERDRNSEFFAVMLEVEPSESLRVTARAFRTELET